MQLAAEAPTTVSEAFARAAARHCGRPCLAILPETARAYGIAAGELSYRDAITRVVELSAAYRAQGYGHGHRVGILVENRPAFFLHWYALNALGASLVPINPDLRSAELEHLVGHSDMAYSAMAMVATGGCLIALDRFHPKGWWQSVRDSNATIVHYLGVMPPILMGASRSRDERRHSVRFGFGAGVGRGIHAEFESRFGFPLIEAWAMTETGAGAVVAAATEPRHTGTSCFGKPGSELKVRIVADDGAEAAVDQPGELWVRHAGPNPRYGFFHEYLKDAEATAAAWESGWFHTGDVVRRGPDGSLLFIDRRKNVIRRSGENISAVEVESVLMQHAAIACVAVAAAPDRVRGDEVFACVVAKEVPVGRAARETLAVDIVAWCLERIAHYKAPGYVAFVPELPLTSTQKVLRGQLKDLVAASLASDACVDTRHLKKRVAV